MRDFSIGLSLGAVNPFGKRGAWLAPAGNTYRRQIDKATLLKLVDHASSSKGFKLSGRGLPSPVNADMFGYLMSTPVWLILNHIAQPANI